MNLILYLSEAVIPILVLLIVGNGLMHRQHVYEDFLEGAKSGIRTAVEIMPTLIGLMAAVGILRASAFGFYFRVAWEINGHDRISDRTDPGCCGKNVLFLCSNGTFTGYLQNTWCRFDAGTCGIGYAQQHRDHFLYHVGLFYVGKSKKDKIYTSGSPFCNHCRNCGKCISCVENLKL